MTFGDRVGFVELEYLAGLHFRQILSITLAVGSNFDPRRSQVEDLKGGELEVIYETHRFLGSRNLRWKALVTRCHCTIRDSL